MLFRSDLGLELYNRLDTLPLHPTGSTGLVDTCYFVQGSLEGTIGLRCATLSLGSNGDRSVTILSSCHTMSERYVHK